MIKRVFNVMAAAAIFLTVGVRAWADGFRNPPEGAATLGRAGVKIVYGDDASAGVHNPANLTDRETPVVGLGVTTVYGRRTIDSELGGFTARSTDRWASLPGVFAAWPLADGPYAVGIALTSPYGRSSRFDQDSPISRVAPYYSILRTVNLNPAVAGRFGENLAWGLGFNALWSDLELRQLMPGAMFTGNPATPAGRVTMQGDGAGFGANAGVTLSIDARQRLAVTYRSPVDITYEGDWTFEIPGMPAPVGGDFETKIKFPDVLALGYGIQATESLRLEVNAEWVRHSRFEKMALDTGAGSPLPPRGRDRSGRLARQLDYRRGRRLEA